MLFEVLYISMLLIVMAVIAAAAGSILEETFGLPYIIGVLGIMLAVGALLFFGSNTMEKFLSGWSFVLYTVYIVMFVWTLSRFGDSIGATLSASGLSEGWAMGGVKYAAYNMAVIAAVLFVVRHIETRKEAITAGLLVGPIAMIPGLLFYLAMLPHYPAIADRPVPANMILEALGSRSFQLLFQIVLFGTLIETGAGMIHSINERIAGVYRERDSELSPLLRSAMAVVFLLVAAGLARMGIIALIAKGYGTITWGFLAVFVIPMLTLGVWRIMATPSGASQTVR